MVSAILATIVPKSLKLRSSGQKIHKTNTIIGTIGSFMGSLLCCSPMLPSLIATIALVLPSVTWWYGVQGFIATNEAQILFLSLALLIYAFIISIRQISYCPDCIVK